MKWRVDLVRRFILSLKVIFWHHLKFHKKNGQFSGWYLRQMMPWSACNGWQDVNSCRISVYAAIVVSLLVWLCILRFGHGTSENLFESYLKEFRWSSSADCAHFSSPAHNSLVLLYSINCVYILNYIKVILKNSYTKKTEFGTVFLFG